MEENVFQEQFSSLLDRISGLPVRERAMLVGLAEDIGGQEQEVARSLNALEQSIDYMRLCVKYLVFDLEATRRENDCLRRLLTEADQSSPEHDESGEDHESFWEDGSE
jgi:hypothetical protein